MNWIQAAEGAIKSYRQMYTLAVEIEGSLAASDEVGRAARKVVVTFEPVIDLVTADARTLARALNAFKVSAALGISVVHRIVSETVTSRAPLNMGDLSLRQDGRFLAGSVLSIFRVGGGSPPFTRFDVDRWLSYLQCVRRRERETKDDEAEEGRGGELGGVAHRRNHSLKPQQQGRFWRLGSLTRRNVTPEQLV